MKITVNGKPEEINSGCRSYLYLDQLIRLLELEQSTEIDVTVNGNPVAEESFAVAEVKSIDRVKIITKLTTQEDIRS